MLELNGIVYVKYEEVKDRLEEQDKEIERLKSNINELEKWHKKEIEEWEESKNKSVNSIAIGEHIISLNKIKELKGSDKE